MSMYGKKPRQYCKVINLQLVKIKKIQAYLLKKRERNTPAPLPSHIKTIYINLLEQKETSGPETDTTG